MLYKVPMISNPRQSAFRMFTIFKTTTLWGLRFPLVGRTPVFLQLSHVWTILFFWTRWDGRDPFSSRRSLVGLSHQIANSRFSCRPTGFEYWWDNGALSKMSFVININVKRGATNSFKIVFTLSSKKCGNVFFYSFFGVGNRSVTIWRSFLIPFLSSS